VSLTEVVLRINMAKNRVES